MKKDLESHILKMAEITGEGYKGIDQIGVLAGQSGVALFQFYCAKYFDDDSFADKGVEIISSCIEMINEGYAYPTYCAGIAGFGWTLQHLVSNEFITLDTDGILSPFDDYLQNQMNYDMSYGNYDFLHGALGYGFYFLNRLENTDDPKLKSKYSAYLMELISQLDSSADVDGDYKKWKSVLQLEKGEKGYNLSLSHGISSIIYFLSKAHSQNVSKALSSKLMRGAVNFVLNLETSDNSKVSLFPSWVEPNKALDYNSRLAWCYGDLGIGLAIQFAASSLNDGNLHNHAMKVLKHAAKRQKQDNTFVVDAGICHGSFGNSHIFNQLYFKKKDKAFKQPADFWLKDGLNRYTGNPKEPFKQKNNKENTWELRLNLLEGLSGIGLTMIDHISLEKNSWNECLMLN